MKKFLLFFSLFFLANEAISQTITRGPYMQTQTSDGIIILWRTSLSTNSKVWWGLAPNALTNELQSAANNTNHAMMITGLQAYTKYYYAVGNSAGVLAGADSSHYFITSPLPYTEQKIRVWATGDFGKGNQGQIDTKQSFEDFTRAENVDPDIWLWLGDNAYDDGKDSEYQSKVFNLPGYSDIFSWLPFWPSPGNHDYNTIWSQNGLLGIPYTLNSISDHDGPYYDMVDVPEQAEAGGFPSTHEVFYSYDYGNVHFLSLNSEVYAVANNNVLNQMIAWIHQDLSQNDKDWVVAYWHQPPYSRGSHDSDDFYEDVMKDMREKVIPVLESYDIDLIVCGHSHVYERSYLLHGHYDYSNTLTPAMILDNSNGNRASGNAYVKNEFVSAPQGTVYAVVGNAGSSEENGTPVHPAMYTKYEGDGNYGSMIVDIYKNELRGRHLTIQGTIVDDFSIVKQNMTISAGSDTSMCQFETLTLSAQISKGSDSLIYLWTPGNFNTQSIQVSPNANTLYTLQVTDLISGQVSQDQVNVLVANIPNTPVITENGGVLSTVSGYQYKWFRDGVLIPNATSNTYTPSQQGSYQVEIYNVSGCTVLSNLFPFYNLQIDIISDKSEICKGDSIILFLSVSGGTDSIEVEWVNINAGLTSFYYTPSQSQTIYAEGSDFITGEYELDSLEIIVYEPPVLTSIVQNDNVLSINSAVNWNYAWYRNNILLPNSNTASIEVLNDGLYQVLVTDENSCKSYSESFNFLYSSIGNVVNDSKISIFPNPNNGKFTIKTSETIEKVEVFDAGGKLVFSELGNLKNIQLNNVAHGQYLLELTTNKEKLTYKFIIQQ